MTRSTSTRVGIFLQQHRDRACTLGGLPAGATRIFGDIRANNDCLAAGTVQCQVPDRALHAVHAAKTGMLEFGYFTAAGNRWFALAQPAAWSTMPFTMMAPAELSVLGLGAEPEEFHARRVDVVLVDEPHDGCRRHGVDALIRPPNPKTAPDNLANLRPLVVAPSGTSPPATRGMAACKRERPLIPMRLSVHGRWSRRSLVFCPGMCPTSKF